MRAQRSGGPAMRPEFRLAARCAWLESGNRAEQLQAIAALLSGGIDGAAFRALVERHRVPVLAYRVLSRAAREANLRIDWLGALEPGARVARMRALRMHCAWQQLEALCREAGIGVRSLKGTGLSQRLYGDVGMRHSRDIDVLVRPADWERTLGLLAAAGYEVGPGRLPGDRPAAQARIYRRLVYHVECRTPGGVPVEVHSHVERCWNSRLEEHWAQLAWSADEREQNRFDLLYSVLHGSIHGWSRLKWLGDARLLVQRVADRDWRGVLADAARLRLEPLLAETLVLLNWVTGLAPPEEAGAVLEAGGKTGRKLARQAVGWMKVPESCLNSARVPDSVRACYLAWRVGQRLARREQARYWRDRVLFSDTDLRHIALPAGLTGLYPAIRFWTFLRRHFLVSASRLP